MSEGNELAVAGHALRHFKEDDAHRHVGKMEKTVVFMEDNYDAGSSNPITAKAIDVIKGEGLAAIKSQITTLAETSQVVSKVLGEVEKLHPFIGVAVMAFRAMIELELKRRDNDKRIQALGVTMTEMMQTLTLLQKIKDPDAKATDGMTVEMRLKGKVDDIAQDIRDCSHVCDAIGKKKFLTRLVKSPVYEHRLQEFVEKFTGHKTELQFHLSIQTGVGISEANQGISSLKVTARSTNEKISMSLLFQSLKSPSEMKIMKWVENHGGAEHCMNDPELFDELTKLSQQLDRNTSASTSGSGSRGGQSAGARGTQDPVDSEKVLVKLKADLKIEWRESFDLMLERSKETFERKFQVQVNQLEAEIKLNIKRESDRVIQTVTSGPHDRILDTDVHDVWVEMGWKGSAKGRHFVMALRDHYVEKGFDTSKTTQEAILDSDAVSRAGPVEDDWALEHLSLFTVHPLIEAFDQDASGFVTVAELNAFTSSRPQNWSLLRWLAFWAAGFHMNLSYYNDKIEKIWGAINLLLPKVLPSNRTGVSRYLSSLDGSFLLDEVCAATVEEYSDPSNSLFDRFTDYVKSEESRLKSNLESIAYHIDAQNTLKLVTGPGRFERFMSTLIYLLLERHLELIQQATETRVSIREFSRAAATLYRILDASMDRIDNLIALARQQNADLTNFLSSAAHGYFDFLGYTEDECGKKLEDSYFIKTLRSQTFFPEMESLETKNTISSGESQASKDGLGAKSGVESTNSLQQQPPSSSPTDQGKDSSSQQEVAQSHPPEQNHCLQNPRPSIPLLPLDYYDVDVIDTSFPEPLAALPVSEGNQDLPLKGVWNGSYTRFANDWARGLCSLTFAPDESKSETSQEHNSSSGCFVGKGITSRISFESHGRWWRDPDTGIVKALIFSGKAQRDEITISADGTEFTCFFGVEEEHKNLDSFYLTRQNSLGHGFFKRVDDLYFIYRPTPSSFSKNRALARWKFAINVVMHRIRGPPKLQESLIERRTKRKRFIELYNRRAGQAFYFKDILEVLEPDEWEELKVLEMRLSVGDARYFYSLAEWVGRRDPPTNFECDSCESTISQILRQVCLDCKREPVWSSVDLCRNCWDSEFDTELTIEDEDDEDEDEGNSESGESGSIHHDPTHAIIQFHSVVNTPGFLIWKNMAKKALRKANKAFELAKRANVEATDTTCTDPNQFSLQHLLKRLARASGKGLTAFPESNRTEKGLTIAERGEPLASNKEPLQVGAQADFSNTDSKDEEEASNGSSDSDEDSSLDSDATPDPDGRDTDDDGNEENEKQGSDDLSDSDDSDDSSSAASGDEDTATAATFELEDSEEIQTKGIRCHSCDERVSRPCLVCVSCPNRTVICLACSREDDLINQPCLFDNSCVTEGKHHWSHPLVLVRDAERTKKIKEDRKLEKKRLKGNDYQRMMENRLKKLEEKNETFQEEMRNKFGGLQDDVKKKLEGMEAGIKQRFDGLEELLRAVVGQRETSTEGL